MFGSTKGLVLVKLTFLLTLAISACKKNPPLKATSQDPRAKIVEAFFLNIFKDKTPASGLWRAELADVKNYLQQKYLKQYQPKPQENNKQVITALLEDSVLFFRIEGTEVGQLFIVKGYNLTVSAGNLFAEPKNNTFSLVLNKRDPSGKIYSEVSKMSYDPTQDIWLYQPQANHYIRLIREQKPATELIEMYAKDFTTALKEY